MAGQTTMNGSTTTDHRPNGVIDSVNAFGTDLSNLASLQLRLASCDLKESLKRLAPTLVLAGLGVIILPACAVVALLGAAQWVAVEMSLPSYKAHLLVAGVGLVFAALSLLISMWLSRGAFSSFRRSSEEFQRNLDWVRTVLKHSGR